MARRPLASVALVAACILHSGKLMARNGDNEDANVPVQVRLAPYGRVVNVAGQPVPGARVRLLYARSRWSPENGVVQETQAGRDGRFTLPKDVRFHDPAALHDPAEYTFVADAAGLAPGWVVLSPNDKPDTESTLTLTSPTRKDVEVVDRARKPVAGALVWRGVWWLERQRLVLLYGSDTMKTDFCERLVSDDGIAADGHGILFG